MGSFSRDFRYALRTLLRSPGFTIAALLSLALGIGANTAIFTLTSAIFLHALPVHDPAQVLELFTVDHATHTTLANLARTGISLPNIADIRAQNGVFTDVAGYTQAGVTLSGFGKPTQENCFVVTNNYFDVLGVHTTAGRVFDASTEPLMAMRPEVVLSHGIAQRLFGNDAAAPGHTLNLNSVAYSVVGVAPANFNGTLTVAPVDAVWLPLGMHSQIFNGPFERLFNERRFRFLNVFARLKPQVTEMQADANLQTIAARLEAAYPKDSRGRAFESSPLAEAALGFAPRNQTLAATVALTVAVGFVLLIACANLANLSLARSARRSREMGIRVALGAARGRLMRQLLSEAALLSGAGGVLGIGIGWAGARLLWANRPAFLLTSSLSMNLDWRVFVFTAGLSVLSCALFGILPVFRATSPDLSKLLNSATRGNIQGGGRSPLRALLVVAEMALALIALVGAGLFIRSMQQAQRKDPGFQVDHLEVAGLNLASLQMTPERGRDFLRRVVGKVRALPGVTSASLAGGAPLNGGLLQTAFREGETAESRGGTLALAQPISPQYFDTMRIPLIEGRIFNDFDRLNTTRVTVISQAMARQIWPGQKVIGKRIRFATSPDLYEVIGVVKDAIQFNIGEAPQPVTYFPLDQAYQPFAVLHVRTTGNPDGITPAVAAAVQSMNSELALVNPGSVQTVMEQALWPPRMAATLFGIFGVLGMVLAVIGVYGVMAYIVLQRTSEIGIRMAVGAHTADVMRMVLAQSMSLAGIGIAVGVCGALALTRVLGNLLFDISPNDPATFAIVAAILAATALAAGCIPAWRASQIDPVRALRQE